MNALLFKSNQIFHYTCCNTPKRVTSWRGPSPRHCARATQLLSKKYRSGGEPLATLSPIWPARDLKLRPPAPETNALPLDQLAGHFYLTWKNSKTHIFRWKPFRRSAYLRDVPQPSTQPQANLNVIEIRNKKFFSALVKPKVNACQRTSSYCHFSAMVIT